MAKQIVVVSDLHVGSTMGLWPPEQAIADGGAVQQNKFQRYLWRCWEDLLEQVANMNEPTLVINGDVIDGTNPRNGQMVSNLVSVQTMAAEKVLAPLLAKCGKVYWIRGTEWHEGKVSDDIEQLASRLEAERDPATGAATRWELYLDLAGKVCHFAHHIQSTSVPTYEASIPTREALMLQAEMARFYGNKAPNLRMVIRSHRHRYVQVHLPPDLTAAVTPAWQLKTSFSHKVATSLLPEIGWLAIQPLGERLVIVPHIYPLPRPHIEEA